MNMAWEAMELPMTKAYLQEAIEHRKAFDYRGLIHCRRQFLTGQFSDPKFEVHRLTRDQADIELAQLRSLFAWNEDISDEDLQDQLEAVSACEYFVVTEKAERLLKFLPIREELLNLRIERHLPKQLWELICFSLLDDRSYILDCECWGRLDVRTLSRWHDSLTRLDTSKLKYFQTWRPTFELVLHQVEELRSVAGPLVPAVDAKPIMVRLLNHEAELAQAKSKNASKQESNQSGWRWIIFAAILASSLVRILSNSGYSTRNESESTQPQQQTPYFRQHTNNFAIPSNNTESKERRLANGHSPKGASPFKDDQPSKISKTYLSSQKYPPEIMEILLKIQLDGSTPVIVEPSDINDPSRLKAFTDVPEEYLPSLVRVQIQQLRLKGKNPVVVFLHEGDHSFLHQSDHVVPVEPTEESAESFEGDEPRGNP